MEKYNRVHFEPWALFSARILFITLVFLFLLNRLGEWLDNISLSFILLIPFSQLLGFGLASPAINRTFADIYNR